MPGLQGDGALPAEYLTSPLVGPDTSGPYSDGLSSGGEDAETAAGEEASRGRSRSSFRLSSKEEDGHHLSDAEDGCIGDSKASLLIAEDRKSQESVAASAPAITADAGAPSDASSSTAGPLAKSPVWQWEWGDLPTKQAVEPSESMSMSVLAPAVVEATNEVEAEPQAAVSFPHIATAANVAANADADVAAPITMASLSQQLDNPSLVPLECFEFLQSSANIAAACNLLLQQQPDIPASLRIFRLDRGVLFKTAADYAAAVHSYAAWAELLRQAGAEEVSAAVYFADPAVVLDDSSRLIYCWRHGEAVAAMPGSAGAAVAFGMAVYGAMMPREGVDRLAEAASIRAARRKLRESRSAADADRIGAECDRDRDGGGSRDLNNSRGKIDAEMKPPLDIVSSVPQDNALVVPIGAVAAAAEAPPVPETFELAAAQPTPLAPPQAPPVSSSSWRAWWSSSAAATAGTTATVSATATTDSAKQTGKPMEAPPASSPSQPVPTSPDSASAPVPVSTGRPVAIPASPTAPSQKLQYIKSLRLPTEMLKSLPLRPGVNTISYTVRTRLQGTATCQSRIFLWRSDARIVISDIDGTITKSDALGHLFTMVGKDWTHIGVASLFAKIAANGYEFLYLTSRAIGQAASTRGYLKGVAQDRFQLPDGPVIMSPDRLFTALHREVIQRRPDEFKIACLRDIQGLFSGDGRGGSGPDGAFGLELASASASTSALASTWPSSSEDERAVSSEEDGEDEDGARQLRSPGQPQRASADQDSNSECSHNLALNSRLAGPTGSNPFYAGFGNRPTDTRSYRAVGIPPGRIFLVNPSGDLRLDTLLFYTPASTSSYIRLGELVDKIFPPVRARQVAVARGIEDEPFTDLQYWSRARPSAAVMATTQQLLRDQTGVPGRPMSVASVNLAPLLDDQGRLLLPEQLLLSNSGPVGSSITGFTTSSASSSDGRHRHSNAGSTRSLPAVPVGLAEVTQLSTDAPIAPLPASTLHISRSPTRTRRPAPVDVLADAAVAAAPSKKGGGRGDDEDDEEDEDGTSVASITSYPFL